MVVFAACGGHGGSGPSIPTSTRTNFTPTPTNAPLPSGAPTNTSGPTQTPTPDSLQARRQFRALTGVSMGAYGAMNIGTKHADLFGTIAALGGPVDMRQLLRDMVNDNLEVKPQAVIPLNVGDDFTFDHQEPYPGRDTRLSMIKDLVIAFGNPFLHHPDPSRQYLAMDSEPAHILRDDVFGSFTLLANPRGFLDGGDANQDGLRQTTETATQPVLIYRPPAYFHTNRSFPIVYILGGYGQAPEDFEQLGTLFDLLILANQVQNMFVAVLPGAGGRKGSFYVNHRVPESQVPDLINPTSGRYEDSIIQDLIPTIENTILQGRVRQ
jgi:pimeloyl-ACP methyl ester carboxylesterase